MPGLNLWMFPNSASGFVREDQPGAGGGAPFPPFVVLGVSCLFSSSFSHFIQSVRFDFALCSFSASSRSPGPPKCLHSQGRSLHKPIARHALVLPPIEEVLALMADKCPLCKRASRITRVLSDNTSGCSACNRLRIDVLGCEVHLRGQREAWRREPHVRIRTVALVDPFEGEAETEAAVRERLSGLLRFGWLCRGWSGGVLGGLGGCRSVWRVAGDIRVRFAALHLLLLFRLGRSRTL